MLNCLSGFFFQPVRWEDGDRGAVDEGLARRGGVVHADGRVDVGLVQGDTSGCSQGSVDIKIKVVF